VQAQIADLKAWMAAEEAKDRDELAWFNGHIERYVQALLAAGKVRYGEKSYPLPNGQRIGYRWTEAEWQITDPDALFAWAKPQGFVRAKEETDWGDQVKPRLVSLQHVVGSEAMDRESGEVVPGVVCVRPAGDQLMVSEVRRRGSSRRLDPSAGGGEANADVRQHAGVEADAPGERPGRCNG
jgi:hypothetical protein